LLSTGFSHGVDAVQHRAGSVPSELGSDTTVGANFLLPIETVVTFGAAPDGDVTFDLVGCVSETPIIDRMVGSY
jgi:hypothetical protein